MVEEGMYEDDDDIPPPPGVKLRDPEDTDTLRGDIENGISEAMKRYVHGYEYNGVRMELDNVHYADKERYSLAEQKEAQLSDRTLTRRLRGTVKLVDATTNEVLDKRDAVTLARVPYLTQRGTFLHNGTEYACFHGTTKVWTEEGLMEIRSIVRRRLPIRVWSWDFAASKLVLRRVTNWFSLKKTGTLGKLTTTLPNGSHPELMQGRTAFSTVWCTPDHRVYGPDGVKVAAEEARAVSFVRSELSDSQRQMVIGTMLGDGHIQAPGVYRVSHCAAQREYVELKLKLMAPFTKPGTAVTDSVTHTALPQDKNKTLDKKSFAQCGFNTCNFAAMADMREAIYPAGERNLDTNWFEVGDARALAFWYCDDGSARYQRSTNSPRVTLHTNNFTKADVAKLRQWLADRWDLHTLESHKYGKSKDAQRDRLIELTGGNAWAFLELVAPYVPDCLRYKLLHRPHSRMCQRSCGRATAPNRKVCTPCYLAEVRSNAGSLSKSVRIRFGDSSTARKAADEGADGACDDYIAERWERLQAAAGSGIAGMLGDISPPHTLQTVTPSYDHTPDGDYAKAQTVFDIEVEGTHNYFANGILVSNCVMQSRLLPGAYARKRDNGEIEVHFNTRPGTGSAMRVTLDPSTGQYRLKIGTSDLHAYSVFKDLGVSDEELERRWGLQMLDINRSKYSKDAIDRAYLKAVPKWQRDPALPREEKIREITSALGRAQVAESILKQNLPNLFSREKAAFWRSAGVAIEKAASMTGSRVFDPDLTPDQMIDAWQELDFDILDAEKAAAFDPDLAPADLKESYNAIYGGHGPRLASMRQWPAHWLDDQDGKGWLEWYENFTDGRRTEQDAKQIARWQSFKQRHGAQFKSKPTPRRAYALKNWAIDPLQLLPEDKRDDFEQEMEAYRRKEHAKWMVRRHDFDEAAATGMVVRAKRRGAPEDSASDPATLMRLAEQGFLTVKDMTV